MCLKKMLRFNEATATYKLLRDAINRVESRSLVSSVFSLVTLFAVTERSKVSDSLDNLQSMMDFYGIPTYEESDSIAPFYVEGDGWLSDKVELVISMIKNRHFFRRFSKSHLVIIPFNECLASLYEVHAV